jgi:putative two-component system response regulator
MSKAGTRKILVVDDVVENIHVLKEILKSEYHIIAARGGQEALKLIHAEEPPDLVLLDVMMPGMDGYEVCKQVQANPEARKIPIIFVTAMGEVADETHGLELGAVDYLIKPVSAPIVRARVHNHLELKHAREALERQNIILEEKVKERTRAIRETQQETLVRLMNASELRDTDTGLHIKRIQFYAELMAKKMNMGLLDAEELGLAATLHDLGKIGIPDSVLLKPGKLNAEEWAVMKKHPEIGAHCLEGSKSRLLEQGRLIALHHHERWDGTGYPAGLKAEAISLAGCIVGLVDVFDALSTKRPYKEPWPIEKVLELIEEGKEKHFDPKLADILLSDYQEFMDIGSQLSDLKLDAMEGALT